MSINRCQQDRTRCIGSRHGRIVGRKRCRQPSGKRSMSWPPKRRTTFAS